MKKPAPTVDPDPYSITLVRNVLCKFTNSLLNWRGSVEKVELKSGNLVQLIAIQITHYRYCNI